MQVQKKSYSVTTADGITIIRFTKAPGSADLIEAVNDLATNGCSRLRLWDVQVGLEFTPNEARIMAATLDGIINTPGSRYAFLVSSNHDFGMARLFSAYYQADDTEGNVFRNEVEAIDWLKEYAGTRHQNRGIII